MSDFDSTDLHRLWEAIAHSREKLRPFRENRLDAIKQYVGSHYGNNGADEDVPVNFLELATSIYVQQLVGAPPRSYVTTEDRELKYAAADLRVALDFTIERIHLEETLSRLVQDAIFSVGILKIGLVQGDAGESERWWNDAWQPFVDWVDLDDWVHDMTAKTWESIAFCGNRYRLPLDVVRNCEDFDPKIRKRLQPTRKQTTTESGDEKAETIAGGLDTEVDEYEDEVELWDIWLPRKQLVVTLPADDEGSPPLREARRKGHRDGPYIHLGFGVVPSNVMPLPPVAIWKDLHDLGNKLYLKLGDQALRQKSILPFRGGNEEDAQRIADTSDGGVVRVDGDLPQEVTYGGPDQVNLAFFLGLNELVNRHFGNLDTLGGLSAQAETLGQEQMLGANASQRIIYMRRRLNTVVDQVMTRLSYFLYDDPLVDMQLSKPVARTNFSVPFRWTPETRRGEPSLYRVAIEPYSMVHRTPESQMQMLIQVWQQIVMPATSLLPPESLLGAVNALLKMIAEKQSLPELSDLLPYLGMSDEPLNRPSGGSMPPVTTRNYTRRSIPGTGRSQKENALAQALLGSMPQPAESAAMVRSTG